MTKYISIIEPSNEECRGVGVITESDADNLFIKAVEAALDTSIVSYSFDSKEVESITDCIDACPIGVTVVVGDNEVYHFELFQTFLYQ